MDQKLYANLAAATRYYSIQDEFAEKIQQQNQMIKKLKVRDYDDKPFSLPITIVLISFILLIASAVITTSNSFYTNEEIVFFNVLYYVSLLLILIFTPIIIKNIIKVNKEYNAKVKPQIAKCEESIKRLENDLVLFKTEHINILNFLPEIYRDRPAISFMFLVVSNGRADTLKEAMNLYEEQLHRWKLESYARQTAETQEYCARALDELNSKQAQTNSYLQSIEYMQFLNFIIK